MNDAESMSLRERLGNAKPIRAGDLDKEFDGFHEEIKLFCQVMGITETEYNRIALELLVNKMNARGE